MILEGDIFLFAAGFLVARGILNLGETFSLAFFGVLSGDSLWYWLGHWINHAPYRFNRWLNRRLNYVDNKLTHWTLQTIFISKFMYSLHHFILIRAGILGIPFRKYLKNDFVSALAWILVVLEFFVAKYGLGKRLK